MLDITLPHNCVFFFQDLSKLNFLWKTAGVLLEAVFEVAYLLLEKKVTLNS